MLMSCLPSTFADEPRRSPFKITIDIQVAKTFNIIEKSVESHLLI